MTASSILHEILDRGEGFGHRQHLELTWQCLENDEPDAVLTMVSDGARSSVVDPDRHALPVLVR